MFNGRLMLDNKLYYIDNLNTLLVRFYPYCYNKKTLRRREVNKHISKYPKCKSTVINAHSKNKLAWLIRVSKHLKCYKTRVANFDSRVWRLFLLLLLLLLLTTTTTTTMMIKTITMEMTTTTTIDHSANHVTLRRFAHLLPRPSFWNTLHQLVHKVFSFVDGL